MKVRSESKTNHSSYKFGWGWLQRMPVREACLLVWLPHLPRPVYCRTCTLLGTSHQVAACHWPREKKDPLKSIILGHALKRWLNIPTCIIITGLSEPAVGIPRLQTCDFITAAGTVSHVSWREFWYSRGLSDELVSIRVAAPSLHSPLPISRASLLREPPPRFP